MDPAGLAATVAAEAITMTVRELIGVWNAGRRGYKIREQIDRDLAQFGLTTTPPYDEVAIDSTVVVSRKAVAGVQPSGPVNGALQPEPSHDLGLYVGQLSAARAGVVGVKREEDMQVAISLLVLNDFSQIVVTSGDTYKGVLSWESIGQARLLEPEPRVVSAMVQSQMVGVRDDLISLVPRIYREGFVVVEDPEKRNRPGGIITTADLTLQFAELATPFFLLGEAERTIRRRLDDRFQLTELDAAKFPGDETREVKEAGDLTLGEMKRLIENPENWLKLGWNLDRAIFVRAFDEVIQLRNDVMHFDPDPIEPQRIQLLRNFVAALRKLA